MTTETAPVSADNDAEVASRLGRHWAALRRDVEQLYGHRPDFDEFVGRLRSLLARSVTERHPRLRRRDRERLENPDWFADHRLVGYTGSVEQFGGTFADVVGYIPELVSLGVNYLHLLPVYEARAGDNDGRFAIRDHRRPDPAFGSLDELVELVDTLQASGVNICLDLVLNHCSDDSAWARAAKGGDAGFREYFVVVDNELRQVYEAYLPEIMPDRAPGNFTFVRGLGWVYTSFNHYQWDLNWKNPWVFLELAETVLWLCNIGVDVVRLDAIPLVWKRVGTDCHNQPEVFQILAAFKRIVSICAPATALKAEALVPRELIHRYVSDASRDRHAADLAYHNALSAHIWSGLATADARLLANLLNQLSHPPGSAWVTYLRNHDDCGWAITPSDTEVAGWDVAAHRSFLADYYNGSFSGSVARGLDYGSNRRTGDRRTVGTTASFAGLEHALEIADDELVRRAIDRIMVGYAIIFLLDGVPLINQGDEWGCRNSYLSGPELAASVDLRAINRPALPPVIAADPLAEDLHRSLSTGLAGLAAARKRLPRLRCDQPVSASSGSGEGVLVIRRGAEGQFVEGLFNLTGQEATIPARPNWPDVHARPTRPVAAHNGSAGTLRLAPYGYLWRAQ